MNGKEDGKTYEWRVRWKIFDTGQKFAVFTSFICEKEGNHPKLKNAATQTARSDKVEYMLS